MAEAISPTSPFSIVLPKLALRWRITLVIFFAGFAAFLIVAGVLYSSAQEERLRSNQRVMALALAGANAFDREVEATAHLLRGLSRSPALVTYDLEALYRQLQETPKPDGVWLGVYNREGQVLNTAVPFGTPLPRIRRTEADPAWSRIRDRGFSVADRQIGPVTKRLVLAISLRLNGPDGQMEGFITCGFSETWLNTIVRREAPPEGWTTTTLDRNLAPVATTSNDPDALRRELPKSLTDFLKRPERDGQFVWTDGNESMLIGYHRSAATDFTTFTSVPLSLAEARLHDARRNILKVAAVILLSVSAFGLLVTRQVKPLERVQVTAAATERRLWLSEARYRSFWNGTNESLFTVAVSDDGRFVFEGLNPAHERATGIKFDDIAGKEPQECLPPHVAEAVTARYQACVDTGEPTIYDEVLDFPSGRRFWQTSLGLPQ